MKILHILIASLSIVCITKVNAQKSCADKLADAKSITMSIARGNNTKSNEEALTAVLVRLSIDCPDDQRAYSKWLQNLDDPANKSIKSDIDGSYQSIAERERIAKERIDNLAKPFKGSQNEGGKSNTNQSSQAKNQNSNMIGDGYAELPFNDNDDKNSNIQNTYSNSTNGDSDWIDTKKTIRRNSNNAAGGGASGNAIEIQRQNEKYKSNAHNQIQNSNGGFKSVENEDGLIKPKLNLNSEIKNFENKLSQLPENQRSGLLEKGNAILKNENDPQIAARKLVNLVREYEKNNGTILSKNNVQNNYQGSPQNKQYQIVEPTSWEINRKKEEKLKENKTIWQSRFDNRGVICTVQYGEDYENLQVRSFGDNNSKKIIYDTLAQYGKKVLKENGVLIYFIP